MTPLSDIIATIYPERIVGPKDRTVSEVCALSADVKSSASLLWAGERYLDQAKAITEGVLICPPIPVDECHPAVTYLFSRHPRRDFMLVLKYFFTQKIDPSIATTAVIHPSAIIGKRVHIGEFAIIEADCRIGDDSSIDHHTVLKTGTQLGQRVRVGAHTVIGGTGFGYEKNEAGQYQRIPHIANVRIADDVEIGDNTTIDRGVLSDTLIEQNAKIDNLVHIAHGVHIGKNAIVIAHAMVAGSCHIGEDAWIAPGAQILNKVRVGPRAIVGMGAVVLKDVPADAKVVGNPGRQLT